MTLPAETDVLIIGAGAAGLFCGAVAGKRGRRALIVDHANKPGKKILMSGGGRCNFTNLFTEPGNYLSENAHFCKSALKRFTQWDFLELVKKHDIAWHEKKLGQLFCDGKAQAILDMLLDECAEAGTHIRMNCSIEKIETLSETSAPFRYRVFTNQGNIRAESVVIATGGLSIPTLGASGFGYNIAKEFNLKLHPLSAGLVPFTLSPEQLLPFKACVGNSLEVTAQCDDQQFTENLLFTHRGLSGPAMLQISSFWKPGKILSINLLPFMDLLSHLKELQKQRPKVQLLTIISELMTRSLAETFCGLWCDNKSLADYSYKEFETIANHFHSWELIPAGTEGYRTAEVTLGGVDTDELSSKTMESKKHPGLFFIGEVVDVTGHLGGFNFQWAWASAHACGTYA